MEVRVEHGRPVVITGVIRRSIFVLLERAVAEFQLGIIIRISIAAAVVGRAC